jgi:biopolymer transport protein ExbD
MKAKTRRFSRRSQRSGIQPGFQIAPMIDVVFVILLFFIVQAAGMKVENSAHYRLPSPLPVGGNFETPDEVSIAVEADGSVYLNDDPIDAAASPDLPHLAAALEGLRKSSEATCAELQVIVQAHESARYQRVMDVMDALTRTRIENVSFAANALE